MILVGCWLICALLAVDGVLRGVATDTVWYATCVEILIRQYFLVRATVAIAHAVELLSTRCHVRHRTRKRKLRKRRIPWFGRAKR